MDRMEEDAQDGAKIYLIRQVLAALRAGGIEAEVYRMYGSGVEVVIGLPGVRGEWFGSEAVVELPADDDSG